MEALCSDLDQPQIPAELAVMAQQALAAVVAVRLPDNLGPRFSVGLATLV